MRHRISAGCMVLRDDRVLLVRHFRPGIHDFWAAPGGGVEGDEELAAAAAREVLEETGITAAVERMIYIDELIDQSGRMVKFWHLARYESGEIDVTRNPAEGESISEAGWFGRRDLPGGHVFPEVLRGAFWDELDTVAAAPIKLPLRHSIF